MRRKESLARDHNEVLAACAPFWRQLLRGHCVPRSLVPAHTRQLEYHAQWKRESRHYSIEVTSRMGSVTTKFCPSFNEAVDTVTVMLLAHGASCGFRTLEQLKDSVATGERQLRALRNQLLHKEVELEALKAWMGSAAPILSRWESK